MASIKSFQKWLKEPFCAVSHGLGVALSIAGLIVLLVLAHGRPWQTVSFALYGATMIVLYLASTLYHSLKVGPRAVELLRRIDHTCIFLLIVGTYTPVCLVGLRGPWGFSILGAEYVLATIGILCTVVWKGAPDWIRVVLYIVMGWLILIAVAPLRHALSPAAVSWLFAGGVVYSIGTVIFAANKPHLWPGKFSAHDLWHIFVLGGSACHFVLMAAFISRIG